MPSLVLPTIDSAAEDIDLADDGLWSASDEYREAVFKKLRDDLPVSFQKEPDYLGVFPQGPGYWALTRYDDVAFASRNPDLFASGRGGSNIPDLPPGLEEWLGSIINMDSPKHTKLRLLVNRGFTPRMVAKVEEQVRVTAREIVADVAARGEVDFVVDVAAPMPLRIICDMIGIPRSDEGFVFRHTNAILAGGDEEYASSPDDVLRAGQELWQYANALGQERAADPTDDITSALMRAEVDGQRLTADEFGSFFVLLVVAGNETTRNAMSHGLLQLTRHPDQRRAWQADFERFAGSAIEEIVRWATPVIHFRRTATADVTLPSGREVKEGEKVVLWYSSANRDERFWERPFDFDIARAPNEHVGFGAGGPHFCLGANLARREIKVLFDELWSVLPDIEATGEPAMLRSAFIHGIKHLEASFTPR
ncbi:MAG: cytochrome P450 [Acidimicrobiales bacterium]